MPIPTISSFTTKTLTPPVAVSRWHNLQYWLPVIIGHTLLLVSLYSVFYCFGILDTKPTSETLMRWDSGWYDSIRTGGYTYREDTPSNVAFFPFFPYFWRSTGLDAMGICIVNTICGIIGVVTLAVFFRCSRVQAMLIASVPALFFTHVPYTEAIFYLFGAILLAGLHRQNISLFLFGALGCCLVRTAGTFFVAALILTELIYWLNTKNTAAAVSWLLAGLGVIIAGVGFVLVVQHAQTGEWLGFYKTQRHWYHYWRYPDLPLRSSAGINMLWLDVIGVSAALLAAIVYCRLLVSRLWLLLKNKEGKSVSKAIVFSLIYCACAGIFVVFQQGGDLCNASRYILGTPFFAVLLWGAWQEAGHWSSWVLGGVILLVMARYLGLPNRFDGFWPVQSIWYFSLTVLYVAGMIVSGSVARIPWKREMSGMMYLFNVVLQLFLLNWFISGAWLG